MLIGSDLAWEVTVHRSLEEAVSKWMSFSAQQPNCCAVFHIGFDRPKSRYFNDIVSEHDGKVLLTAAAKFGMLPYSHKLSKYPIAYVNEEPVYLAMDGWGYVVKHDPSHAPARTDIPESAQNEPIGLIADFISAHPYSASTLKEVGIFDGASYYKKESHLPNDLRASLGRYIISPIIKRDTFDICEFARKCPPWVAEREIETLELKIRAKNVYSKQGLKTVRDLGQVLTETNFLNFRNYGRKSIWDTRDAVLAALSEGPVGLAEEAVKNSNLIEAIYSSLEGLSKREKDIVCRRMGVSGASQTLEEISETYNITRQGVREAEKKAIKKLMDKNFWDDLLEEKVEKMLASTTFPIAISGIEALDDWFFGVSENIPLFTYVFNAKLGGKYNIIKVENLTYLCEISQDEWDALVFKSKELLRGTTLNGKAQSYAKSVIAERLPENAREFSDLLWDVCSKNCQFVKNEAAELILVGEGRGAEMYVQTLLEHSNRPLHYSEIFERLNNEESIDFDIRRTHSAAAEVGLLFGRGTYGLEKHIPFDESTLQDIASQIVSFIEQNDEERQWHCQEFIDLVEFDSTVDSKLFNKYIVDIVLKKYSNLSNLGRMSWQMPSVNLNAADRIGIYDLISEVIDSSGRPLKTGEIEEAVRKKRGLSRSLQIQDVDPIIRIAPGLWGLNDRDIGIKRFQQPEFIDNIYSKLSERGAGIHIEEINELVDPNQISPWALFSLCKTDARFITDLGQYLYLVEWGDSRRKAVSEVIKEVLNRAKRGLSLEEIHYEAELELGRSIEQRRISILLANIGATLNPDLGTWTMPEQHSELDE